MTSFPWLLSERKQQRPNQPTTLKKEDGRRLWASLVWVCQLGWTTTPYVEESSFLLGREINIFSWSTQLNEFMAAHGLVYKTGLAPLLTSSSDEEETWHDTTWLHPFLSAEKLPHFTCTLKLNAIWRTAASDVVVASLQLVVLWFDDGDAMERDGTGQVLRVNCELL